MSLLNVSFTRNDLKLGRDVYIYIYIHIYTYLLVYQNNILGQWRWPSKYGALDFRFWQSCILHTLIANKHLKYINLLSSLSFMMTSSNGNAFRVTGPLCGKFTGRRWIPLTKASDAELWCFFYLRLNKRFSRQSWGWWFDMPSCSLWRHCNDETIPWFVK